MTTLWRTPAGLHTSPPRLPIEGELPSFDGATGWLNTPPLTAADLRGHVVLVNFWTYTCINWLRQLPYVRAWAEKYADHSVAVIGVHTPEFPFEHDPANVRLAIQDMEIDYPVVTDNDYAIWNAFSNHYWPALYFADAHGRIRHHQYGEGEYQQSEMVIQQLLVEAGATDHDHEPVVIDPRGVETPADWANLRSPENYTGYERTLNFASPGGGVPGRRIAHAIPGKLRLNHWALAGDWMIEPQAVALLEAGGRIAYRFHARDLNLVMGPTTPGAPIRLRTRIDGQRPGAAHGADSDSGGSGTVAEQRLYQLLRQPGPIADRTVEIAFLDPGVQVYAFTFG